MWQNGHVKKCLITIYNNIALIKVKWKLLLYYLIILFFISIIKNVAPFNLTQTQKVFY